ncbi:MAG: hypothetical protein HGA44_05580 [Cellulomonadaceae bacterium]|nr:hypothetical protein [Cellulomonadaceae bacterium]
MPEVPEITEADALLVREFHVREVAADKREFTGISVPWGETTSATEAGYREVFERGSVDDEGALIFWRHHEPIGRVVSAQDTDAGREIIGALSDTTLGRDAYTLLRDGVVVQLSIGFRPVEQREEFGADGSLTVTRTKVKVREVSLTPNPAYPGAAVTQVRSAHEGNPTPKENAMPTATTEDLLEVRESVEEMQRLIATFANREQPESEMVYRSAGQLLKDLVRGDESALREYNDTLQRSWADNPGAVLADGSPRKGWVGDLTRLVDEAAVLASLFSSGSLPDEGNTLEYAELLSNTVDVTEQAEEGDDLAFGKVATTVKNATIHTFGGYSTLSFQSIQRSSVPLLNHTLNAIAIAAGKRRNAVYRSVFAAARASQVTAGNTVTVADSTDYADWLDAIIDGAEKYTDLGLSLDAMVTDKTVFKGLARLVGADGRPMMSVQGTGTNVVGSLNVKAISGELASVPVRLNPKQAAPGATLTNRLAIREYRSGLVRLQDENVVNLSKDFSAYFYAAHAVEIPAAIVPVTITA